MKNTMKSQKPYLVNAYRAWLEDNNYSTVGTFFVKGTTAIVPETMVCSKTGTVTLDISSLVSDNIYFDGDCLSFRQVIGGILTEFSIPLDLTVMLKAKEVKDDSVSLPFDISDEMLETHKFKCKYNGLRLVH